MMQTGTGDESPADTSSNSSDFNSSGNGSGGTIGMGAQGVGTAVSAVGALYAGEMESSALQAQATIQGQNAQLDLDAGNANAARSQILSGQRIGSIQASAGASGVQQSGSVLSVMAASSMNAEMDRQNVLHGAQVKAIQAENQQSMDSAGAQSALMGGYLKAAGGVAQAALMLLA